MLIKHKIRKTEPTSVRYLFIELNIEDFRCKNSILKRVTSIAKKANGAKRANVFRIPRHKLTETLLAELIYLDKVSTRYKQCLLKSNFNYKYRQFDSNYRGSRSFKAL